MIRPVIRDVVQTMRYPTSSKSAIVWFKNDLRLDDNPALANAASAQCLLCVFCVDARFEAMSAYGTPKVGLHRWAFVGESLATLRRAIADAGGRLIVRRGEPEQVLPELVDALGADTVWTEHEIAPEEIQQLERVRASLADTAALRTTAANTLYQQSDLPFALADMPRVYTPFRKQVETGATVRAPIDAPRRLPGPASSQDTLGDEFQAIDWPANRTPFAGGEQAAHARLHDYFWRTNAIAEYKKTRNGLLGMAYSSKFSPWLAAGSISARRIAAALADYEDRIVANKSTYWLLFELRWREFFHWILAAEGSCLFQRSGLQGRLDRPTEANADILDAWQRGLTGLPFVDAGMRELAATGYLSNRARQNVASYLARDLGQDWRYGAAWFEAQLVDYDVASNWGNWATVAGVGTDKRDNGFNVIAQAERYDASAEYVSHWLPELRALPPRLRHRPWQADDDTLADIGYPRLLHPPV